MPNNQSNNKIIKPTTKTTNNPINKQIKQIKNCKPKESLAVKDEIQKLKNMKEQVIKSLKNAPDGRIRCEMARGKYPQYYFVCDGEQENPRGRYMKKTELSLVRRLVQKEYNIKVLEKNK